MNKNILIAVLSGVLAVTAYLLSTLAPIAAESALACVAVLGILGVAALDYGITGKRVIDRA